MEKVAFRGKDYPVEINMRVIDAYLRAVSGDSIASLESGYPSDLLMLLFISMTEGAALTGTELDLAAEDLATLRLPEYNALMDEFLPIVKDQLSPKLPADSAEDKKKVEKT